MIIAEKEKRENVLYFVFHVIREFRIVTCVRREIYRKMNLVIDWYDDPSHIVEISEDSN